MRKPKRQPTPPAPPRVLQGVDALLELDRRRKLARVARGVAACAEILRQPETDPRRPYVPRIQTLLAAARGNLERGHRADRQMAEIEALGSRMNRLFLQPLAAYGHDMKRGR